MSSLARKILIVDDDPWVAKLVEFVARDLNLEPILARDGAEALDLFGEQLPDLVVLDVVLPKVDGIEVARRIKTTGPGAFTPVVIVSGIYRGEPEALAKARADAFFAKPLSPEVLGKRLVALFPPPPEVSPAEGLAAPESGEVAFTVQPFALALAKAHQQKSTGVLHLRTRGIQAELTLRDGCIISAHSERWDESLPSILLRQGRLSPERRAQLEMLVTSQAVEDFRQAVVKEGLATSEELTKIVAIQQMLRVTEAFGWTEGFHHFVEEKVSGSAADLETASLVHSGLRRMTVPPRALEDMLPSMTGPLVRKAEADPVLRVLPLSRAEKWLLSQANGKTTFQDLWMQVREDRQASDVLTRAILALHSLGAVGVDIPKLVPVTPLQDRPPSHLPTLEPAPSRPMFGSPSSILLTLWREKANGVLVVDLPDESIVFYLKAGQLVTVRPPGGERLESLLIRRGKIRSDILPQLRLLLAAGRNVGDALVELQAISLMQLHAFVRGELRVALRDLVRKKHVEATFTESPLSAQEHVRHEWDTGLAVIESVRSLDLPFVQTALPDRDALIQRQPAAEALVELLALSPTERNLWNLLGTPQPRERLETIGLVTEADQARALWVLLAVGIARVAEAAPSAPALVEEDVVMDDEEEEDEKKPALPPFDDMEPHEFHSTAPQPTIREAVQAAKEATMPPAEAQGGPIPAPHKRSRESMALPDVAPALPEDGPVPRAMYEQLVEEKRELERRLLAFLDQHGNVVPRELYDQLMVERNDLKAQLSSLIDEVIRLKAGGAFVPTGALPSESTPGPGAFSEAGDYSEGSVISFKRTRH